MKLARRSGKLRVAHKSEDFSPMEGVGNMADCMLVFALGILLALIISWNVDVSDKGEIGKSVQSKYEVEDINENGEETVQDGQNLEEMGKVYKDPETGKYYVVEE